VGDRAFGGGVHDVAETSNILGSIRTITTQKYYKVKALCLLYYIYVVVIL